MSLVILADDLTGAADCAARCRAAGMAATIYLRPPDAPLPPGVVALTSDSRHLLTQQAAERVRAMATALGSRAGAATWYKKIDSTLRGHLGVELDAMLDALAQRWAVVCPAFPAQGRGLHHGHLVCAPSPAHPAHLPTLLAQQSRRVVAAVPLEDVRAGVGPLAAQLARQAQQAHLLVVDSLTDDDLRTVVAAVEQALPDALLCGSAGLIGALAAARAGEAAWRAGDTSPALPPPGPGPALLVVGSGSAPAHRQIAYLRRQRVATLEAGSGPIPDRADDLLLHLPEPPPDAALEGAAARAHATELAVTALAAIARVRPALLVLSGGDTAIAVLQRLGIERLEVLRELLPGIPLTWGVDRQGHGYHVVLKAGSFGDDTTLAILLKRVRDELGSWASCTLSG
jgi:uncharacterized protein YgbK (DUF1537 family)